MREAPRDSDCGGETCARLVSGMSEVYDWIEAFTSRKVWRRVVVVVLRLGTNVLAPGRAIPAVLKCVGQSLSGADASKRDSAYLSDADVSMSFAANDAGEEVPCWNEWIVLD